MALLLNILQLKLVGVQPRLNRGCRESICYIEPFCLEIELLREPPRRGWGPRPSPSTQSSCILDTPTAQIEALSCVVLLEGLNSQEIEKNSLTLSHTKNSAPHQRSMFFWRPVFALSPVHLSPTDPSIHPQRPFPAGVVMVPRI